MKQKKIRIKPVKLLGNLIVYAYALILTIPLFFIIVTAFKSETERIMNPIGMPETWRWENFVTAWVDGNLLSAFKNSVIISVSSTILTLIFVVIVSYCLNKIRDTKTGTALYMLVLCAMFIPKVGTVVSLMLRRQLGLYNNLYGEIIAGSFNITVGVFMVSGFLKTIPAELEEAAMLDGATDTQICLRVIVPVIKSCLAAVGILQFKGIWNNALGPMLTLRDKDLFTIPMALLNNFATENSTIYTTMFAGVILTSIPVVILYCLCQKQFEDAMVGSVKG